MSWKSLLIAGFASCVLSSSAMAAPTIMAKPRPYAFTNQATGGIQWEIFVTQNDAAYTGALSVEIPFTLTQVAGPAGSAAVTFPQFLSGDGGDITNGGAQASWYYNETAPASGVGLWNTSTATPPDLTDVNQNKGTNPFCPGSAGCPVSGSVTEGMFIDTTNRRVFLALGSTVNLPDAFPDVVGQPNTTGKQVRVARIFSSDGILNWTNAIVGENGVQYTGISGSSNSISPGDTNGAGNMNPTTGVATDPASNADITDFRTLISPGGLATYNAAHPGLNGAKRGDYNGSGTTTNADITGFRNSLSSPTTGAGSSVGGGSSVPEPTSVLLLVIAGLMACVRRSRRS